LSSGATGEENANGNPLLYSLRPQAKTAAQPDRASEGDRVALILRVRNRAGSQRVALPAGRTNSQTLKRLSKRNDH
jgi:hypothetical protein